jgi:membrane-associated phospholipid phosphatase
MIEGHHQPRIKRIDAVLEETWDISTAGDGNGATRREFLANLRGATAITLASSAATFGVSTPAMADSSPSTSSKGRAQEAFEVREKAALANRLLRTPKQTPNRDEQLYPNFIGNYTKGLPHYPNGGSIGEVQPAAYQKLLHAIDAGSLRAFEDVPLGGTVKLGNPLSGLAFELEGTDSHQLAIPAAPPVASQVRAAEAVELYWMALLRDVNFSDYATHPMAQAAAAELSSLSSFNGPKIGRNVTAQTLFRGFTAGDLVGPYVSQLNMQPFMYGPYSMTGQMSMYVPGVDYMTTPDAWLAVQNGQGPFASNQVDPQPRFIRNGRDYAMYVHTDPNAGLFISFYNAAIWLFAVGAALNPGNPYRNYRTQFGFGTFGFPFFLGMIGECSRRAFEPCWYQKWFVHRNLRPEEYGGLVHRKIANNARYPLPDDVLKSAAVSATFSRFGTFLLPQAFPEGCPQFPAYPSGHATMAGACATLLKAAFDGTVPFASLTNGQIVMASPDGLSLVPYTGVDAAQMTLNGEINKLASNIGISRNISGIHWRVDAEQGMLLGEALALSILSDQSNNYPGENFNGFTIEKFDGTTVEV